VSGCREHIVTESKEQAVSRQQKKLDRLRSKQVQKAGANLACQLKSLVQLKDAQVYAALLAFEQKYQEVRAVIAFSVCELGEAGCKACLLRALL